MSYQVSVPDIVPLSPREIEHGSDVELVREVDRIGRGAGGLAVYAARVRHAGHPRSVGRVILALDRPSGAPMCIRVRDEEIDQLIAALEAARREIAA